MKGSRTAMVARIRRGKGSGSGVGVHTIRASSPIVGISCVYPTSSVRTCVSVIGPVSSGLECLAPFGGSKGEYTADAGNGGESVLTLRPEDSPVCSRPILGFVRSSVLKRREGGNW